MVWHSHKREEGEREGERRNKEEYKSNVVTWGGHICSPYSCSLLFSRPVLPRHKSHAQRGVRAHFTQFTQWPDICNRAREYLAPLVADLSRNYKTFLFSIEISVRGQVSSGNKKRLKAFVYRTCSEPKSVFKSIVPLCSKVSLLSSFSIFMARSEPSWDSPSLLKFQWHWLLFIVHSRSYVIYVLGKCWAMTCVGCNDAFDAPSGPTTCDALIDCQSCLFSE